MFFIFLNFIVTFYFLFYFILCFIFIYLIVHFGSYGPPQSGQPELPERRFYEKWHKWSHKNLQQLTSKVT